MTESWWISAQHGDRSRFYLALEAEQERITALGISATAPDIALHRRTRKQLAKDAERRKQQEE